LPEKYQAKGTTVIHRDGGDTIRFIPNEYGTWTVEKRRARGEEWKFMADMTDEQKNKLVKDGRNTPNMTVDEIPPYEPAPGDPKAKVRAPSGISGKPGEGVGGPIPSRPSDRIPIGSEPTYPEDYPGQEPTDDVGKKRGGTRATMGPAAEFLAGTGGGGFMPSGRGLLPAGTVGGEPQVDEEGLLAMALRKLLEALGMSGSGMGYE